VVDADAISPSSDPVGFADQAGHAVYINPYDPEKYVWVVDDYSQAIFKFSHDGKQLVQTIGTPGVSGADDKHFNRPTFLAWLPIARCSWPMATTARVSRNSTRMKVLLPGHEGNPPTETRPAI